MPTTPSAETRLQELQQALQQREQLLGRIPGVVKAQVGYRTRDGRLTDELAILVTVMRKRPPSALAPGEEAVQVLAGLPVDVVQASIAEQLAFVERPAQLAGPTSLIAPPPWETPLPADPLSFMDGDNYVPPDDIKLAEVDKKMSVLCHVSPDAGWPNLKKFIESIEKRLTLAMYDLSAPHIVRRLGSHIKSIRGQLHCIVDPSDTKNGKFDELEETDAIERLDRAIAKFDLVWASVKKNGSLFNRGRQTLLALLRQLAAQQPAGDLPADQARRRAGNEEAQPRMARDRRSPRPRRHVRALHRIRSPTIRAVRQYPEEATAGRPVRRRRQHPGVVRGGAAQGVRAAARREEAARTAAADARQFPRSHHPADRVCEKEALHSEPVFLDPDRRHRPGAIPQARRRDHQAA